VRKTFWMSEASFTAGTMGVPWEQVGMDFTKMHRSHDGYKKMFVMIDHATKFVIAKPVKDESAKTVAKIFFEELIRCYERIMER